MNDDFEEISLEEAARLGVASHQRASPGMNAPPELSDADLAALVVRYKVDHAAFLDKYGEFLPRITERLRARFIELQATTSAWLTKVPKIVDEKQADDCAGFGKQLLALGKEADALRKVVKAVHDDAADGVQDTFKPILDGAKACLQMLGPKHTAWLEEVDRKLREAERIKREEAAEAERKAKEALRKAEALIAAAERGELQDGNDNIMRDINEAAELEREAETKAAEAREAAGAKAQAGGQYQTGGVKRASHLSSRKVPQVNDPKAACKWLSQKKLRAGEIEVPFPIEVTEAIEKAARRLLKTFPELQIPGVELVEDRKARF